METNTNDTEAKQSASAGCHPTPCSSLVLSVGINAVSIVEHPDFRTPRNDWGVVPAHWEDAWYDEETDEEMPREFIPEDRSGYRPELDGKSLADMWDFDRNEWAIQPPRMEGITCFLRPEYSWTNVKGHAPTTITPQDHE